MGGISIDSSDVEPFIPNSQRSTLTANGVSLLLKHEPQLLPDISEEEVKDKSKGSSFTKLVAFIQAAWFCFACIVRLAQRLPASLLELNTFAHALCTLIVYILWWKKPLNIEKPLIVHDDRIRPLLAYMWMASKTSCIPKPKNPGGGTTIRVGRDPEFEAITFDMTTGGVTAAGMGVPDVAQLELRPHVPPVLNSGTLALVNTPHPAFQVTTSEVLPGTGFRANDKSTRWKVETTHFRGDEWSDSVDSSVHYNPAVFNLTPCDARRWKLAREAMDLYHLPKPDKNLYLVTTKSVAEFSDSENYDDTGRMSAIWFYLGFFLVSAAYGGLHAVAWDTHFPSHREMVLWRVSALIIASPAVMCALAMLFSGLAIAGWFIFRPCIKLAPAAAFQRTVARNPSIIKATKQAGELSLSALWILFCALAPSVLIFLYFPARCYLIYESFRTVFFLPPEAFKATWTQYIPHIT